MLHQIVLKHVVSFSTTRYDIYSIMTYFRKSNRLDFHFSYILFTESTEFCRIFPEAASLLYSRRTVEAPFIGVSGLKPSKKTGEMAMLTRGKRAVRITLFYYAACLCIMMFPLFDTLIEKT